jgi:RimJ/RimL family protein N-acetyltransferase
MGTGAAILRSERLELTPIAEGDREPLLALLRLEPVRHYLLDGHVPDAAWIASVVANSRDDFARRGLGLWAARRPGDPSLVGLVGFRDFYDPPVEELLFALHPDAWGQGLAPEMARAASRTPSHRRARAHATAPTFRAGVARRLLRLGMREIRREPRRRSFK